MILKRIIPLLVLLLSFQSYAQQSGYKISFEVKGYEDSVAYLGYHFGTKKYLQDTALHVKGGRMIFDGTKALKPGVYFLYSPKYYLEFVVNEQNFSIASQIEDSYSHMVVKNSQSNEQFRDFQQLMITHQKRVREISSSLDSTSIKPDSMAVYEQLRKVNVKNEQSRDSLESVFKGSFVADLLFLMDLKPEFQFTGNADSLSVDEKRDQYYQYQLDYFGDLDFNSEGLLRTPIFDAKINEYLDKVTIQTPDSVISSVDFLLKKSETNEELYRYLMVTFFQKYQNHKIMGMDKVFVHLSDEYYLKGKATWADDAMIKELKEEMVFHRDNQIENKAPQIYFQDTLGVTSNLYAIKDDYVILYFYSPTCGHCKKKTPVLKDVYDQLKGKAEVVAVCTDTDMDQWKAFIKELNLNWLNYADMGHRSNFRIQYNVRSTPVLYILDKDKNIIAKKLDVEQVKGFIEEQIRRESTKDLTN